MKNLDYLLRGFGYENLTDFKTTVFKLYYFNCANCLGIIAGLAGGLRMFLEQSLGLDILVTGVFVMLIVFEMQTGIKASVVKNNQKIKSRKVGRMLLKIGVYISILFMLHSLASRMKFPIILNLELNPFIWLYYTFFIGIVFQLFISYLENLSTLGYAEARGLVGIILRKYNKWFEFDGTKDADNELNK